MIAAHPPLAPSHFKLPLQRHLAQVIIQVPSELDRKRVGFQLFPDYIEMPVAGQKCGPSFFSDLHAAVRRKRQEEERENVDDFFPPLSSPGIAFGSWGARCVRKKKARDGMGWRKRGNIRVRL